MNLTAIIASIDDRMIKDARMGGDALQRPALRDASPGGVAAAVLGCRRGSRC
jgi:hypothetical protein